MRSESGPQAKLSSWIANVIANMIAFFDLPNPRIFTLFMISSSATFCLGIAMILEWGLYSQYQPGYHWITYYAPCLITLPILVWIFCIICASFLGNKDRNLRIVPSLDPPNPKQPQSQVMHRQQHQLLQVDATRNRLALVPVQVVHDPSSESTKEEAANTRHGRDDKSTLKRTFSLSLFGNNKSIGHGSIRRARSFG